MKIHLGFEDFAYGNRYSRKSPLKKSKLRRLSPEQEAYGQGKTTVDVSKELETKYKVVETFYELEEDKIVEMLEEVFAERIEEVMSMKQISDPLITDEEIKKIETDFKNALSNKRFDGVIPRVPTLAATRASRPSFINTGMYQQSFKVWSEE